MWHVTRRQLAGHMAVAGVLHASGNGMLSVVLGAIVDDLRAHYVSSSLFLNSIMRAFLIEEAKIVKKVIKEQQKAGKKAE